MHRGYCLTSTQRTEIAGILSAYREYGLLISSQEYAKEYFAHSSRVKYKEECIERMRAIENLIKQMLPSKEGNLLHLHYIVGLSLEKCAEAMDISRRTAYRVLDRAHTMAFCLTMINQNTIKQ